MNFNSKLISGLFIKRYKRFFVDVKIGSKIVSAHCPNTGSMLGLLKKNNKVWLSKSDNPNRKLKFTLEIIEDKNKKKQGKHAIRWIVDIKNGRYIGRAPKVGVYLRDLYKKRDKDFGKPSMLPKSIIFFDDMKGGRRKTKRRSQKKREGKRRKSMKPRYRFSQRAPLKV